MKNKHRTDTVCSIIQQHLFVFVDFVFLISKANINSSPPKLVQTVRENDGAELLVTSLKSLLLPPCRLVYLFMRTLRKSVIKQHYLILNCHGGALGYTFNPRTSSIQAESGRKKQKGGHVDASGESL